jgi:hypothetical protein
MTCESLNLVLPHVADVTSFPTPHHPHSPTPTSRRPTARNAFTKQRLEGCCKSFLLRKMGNEAVLKDHLQKFSADRGAWDM